MRALLFNCGYNVIQRQVAKQCVTLFRVVSVTRRELVNEPERIDNPDLLGKQLDCLMIHFA
ncbi:MAG TPA: hypothetical protein VMV69_16355 [Pirellulales bacterium]|nr:hypothetical protein [Pirellulales bacterium]